jgi:hypothetical protein
MSLSDEQHNLLSGLFLFRPSQLPYPAFYTLAYTVVGCTANDLNFSDVSGCVDEFDAATLARSPGGVGRQLCMGLSSYRGLSFSPAGGAPSDWVARRVPVDDGPRAYTSCGGAVIVGSTCTALSASYQGPARNASATNVQTVTALAGGRFTLTGISAIVYSVQGVRLTGKKADGGTVSAVLAPNAFLDQTFPPRQWSGLVSLEFRPDLTGNQWELADEIATMKIFWLNTTFC